MTIFIIFLTSFTLAEEIAYKHDGKDLHYQGTFNKSMSKFQRIGYIESYLTKVKSNIDRLNQGQDQKVNEKMTELNQTLANVQKQLNDITIRLKVIEDQLNITKDKK